MDIASLQDTLRRTAAELLQIAEQAGIALSASPGAKTHVLIDWENVQPKEEDCRALVPEATDVWLFHGPNQKNVSGHYRSFGDRATEVRVARTGKNALDFHLSFYIGYIASRHPDARFVVLSNDKGYGPMLEHAKELGFAASQSGFGAAKKKARAPARKAAARPNAAAAPAANPPTANKPAAKKASARKTPAAKTAAPARKAAAKKAAAAKSPDAKSPTAKSPAAKSSPATSQAGAKSPAAKSRSARPSAAKSSTGKSAGPAAKHAPAASRPAARKSFDQVLEILRKAPAQRRPGKQASLLAQLRSLIGGDAEAADAHAMLDRLVAEGKVAVDDRRNVRWQL
jgi:PIN domain-containing protein